MKKIMQPAAMMMIALVIIFSQPLMAADRKPHRAAASASIAPEDVFSVELNPQTNSEVMVLTIKNPGRKSLSVTLTSPGGLALDNFYIGKKLGKVDRAYNFIGAEDGLYTIEVSDGTEKIRKQVRLERITVQPVKLTAE